MNEFLTYFSRLTPYPRNNNENIIYDSNAVYGYISHEMIKYISTMNDNIPSDK